MSKSTNDAMIDYMRLGNFSNTSKERGRDGSAHRYGDPVNYSHDKHWLWLRST